MRIRELQRFLRTSGVDGACFFQDDGFTRYFAGASAEHCALFVPSSGKSEFFVPGFEADRLKKIASVRVVRPKVSLFDSLKSCVDGLTVGVVPSGVSLGFAQSLVSSGAKLVDISKECVRLRSVKTDEELRRISRACEIVSDLFENVCQVLPKCKSERDVFSFIQYWMADEGVKPSFDPIVASGSNAAVPHHVPSNSKLKGFTVIDMGVVWKGYCSDMTRTVFVGVPSERDVERYEKLRRVQDDCVKLCVLGRSLEDVDLFAKESVGSSMIHRVGHSLGVDVHDVQPLPWVFEKNGVVTVEPGSYVSGKFGMRIEDDVIVGKKPKILTSATKSLCVVRQNV